MNPHLKTILDEFPVLEELPWGKDIPAVYRLTFDYAAPLIKKNGLTEPMVGYAFGTDKNNEVIYFSPIGRRLSKGGRILAPNIARPSIDVRFVENLKVETLKS